MKSFFWTLTSRLSQSTSFLKKYPKYFFSFFVIIALQLTMKTILDFCNFFPQYFPYNFAQERDDLTVEIYFFNFLNPQSNILSSRVSSSQWSPTTALPGPSAWITLLFSDCSNIFLFPKYNTQIQGLCFANKNNLLMMKKGKIGFMLYFQIQSISLVTNVYRLKF